MAHWPGRRQGDFLRIDVTDDRLLSPRLAEAGLPAVDTVTHMVRGPRRSDVVLFGRRHMREGALAFTQVKNRARRPVRLTIPVIPELARIIAATPSPGLTFLTRERGTAFTPDTLGTRFRTCCQQAGLPQGLRKAAASRPAELGANPHQIMVVTGHGTLQEVDRYTRAVTQKAMAVRATALIAGSEEAHPGAATPGRDGNTTQPADSKGIERWLVPGPHSSRRAMSRKP